MLFLAGVGGIGAVVDSSQPVEPKLWNVTPDEPGIQLWQFRTPDAGAAVQDTNPPPVTDTLSSRRQNLNGDRDVSQDVPDTTEKAQNDTLLLRRRRGSAADSLSRAKADSTEKRDTSYVIYKDSTYRVQQFVHQRTDEPVVELFPEHPYSLYLDVNSPAYKREVTLDSTGNYVTVREMVNDVDVKVPLRLTLAEYVNLRYEEEKRENWRSMVYEYKKGKGRELSDLFGSLTTISIPVPANPLLSVFGKPIINIRVAGQVGIQAAYKNQSSDQNTESTVDRSQAAPDFNQQVAVSVSGEIGDKLKINADWNTERTFDYENQLKIAYTGYDDEIIQSVEAGNVSMEAPSLIGNSEALFGIKARFQMGPLNLTTLMSQQKGSAKTISINGGATQQPVDIRPQDYATNYFFIDTSYIPYFETLHSQINPVLTPQMQQTMIKGAQSIEVWESVPAATTSDISNRRQVNAFIDLPAIQSGQKYPSSYWAQPSADSVGNGLAYSGYFARLDPSKYTVDLVGGVISLRDNVDNLAVAVAYQMTGPIPGTNNNMYGEFSESNQDSILVLKLVKPFSTLLPSYYPAWELQLKNVYHIGPGLTPTGFTFQIFYRSAGNPDTRVLLNKDLLQATYVDRYTIGATGQPSLGPDGIFDFLPNITVYPQQGDVIFPKLQPFGSGLVEFYGTTGPNAISDSLLFTEIYTQSKLALSNSTTNLYYMHVISSATQQSRISLGSFNLVEGSVTVLLNGTKLTPNVDYTVDYIAGEVDIINSLALQPGANLQIQFEQNDLFQIASKTQLGARAEIGNDQTANLGFTIMNLNQQSLSDKVRLGEEPNENTMMDVNGGLTQNMPFITDALAAIPFLKARDASSFTIHGEGAMDIPDPNTRGSNIPSDNGQSVAYIDDFEGANRTIPLNVLFSGWTLGSVPLYTPLRSYSSDSVLTNVEKTYSKARLLWYNNSATYRPVNSTTVWPNRQVLAQDQFISTLILDYDPNHRGMYNYSPNLDSSLHRASFGVGTGTGMFDTADARRRNWNGIMRYVGTIAGDLLAQNINYLQIWVNTSAANVQDLRRGRLYVDLGAISEDAIPNGVLNSEDIIKTPSNPLGLPTGRVQDGADLGLDMISDAQELQQYDSSFIEPNKKKGKLDPDIDLTDPSGDDYRYTTGDSDFTHYNGTEGNYTGGSPAGRFPDTEDLNGDGTMEPNNAYLEYEVPLDSFYYNDTNMTDLTKYKNPYLIGGNAAASWYEFQIPLKEPARIVTDGETETNETILQNVQYARLWVSGFADPVKFTIAEMDLVGNQWIQPPTQTDSVLSISVENIEDNPGYQSPPGVQRPIDRTDPSQVIQGNEQSLSLVLNKLPQGQEREADKLSTASPLNLFNYAQMKMFVHADPSFQYYDKNHYDAEVFLRFGLDQNNFYECRMPITQTSTGWFEMAVDFSKLTVVKSTRDADTSVHADSLYHLVGTTFGIKGSPALNNIAYIAVGVTNPAAPKGKPFLTGSVWVDELRLVDANNAKGYAYHFDSNLKLSDLGSVGFNYSMTDPNFHGLTDRFGTQIDQTNWAINSNVSFDKYFPMNMQGSTLSFGYSHGESLTDPKYLPGSDVLVDAAAAQANLDHRQSPGNSTTPGDSVKLSSQTLHTQDSYVIPTFRLVLPTKFWLVDETFNKISYTFNYNTTDDRNPTILSSKAWNWNFASQYAVTMPGDLSIQPFKSLFKNVFLLDAYSEWKIYFVPLTNLNASVNATRAASDQVSRDLSAPISYQRSFTSSKSLSFGWHATEGGLLNVSGDYGISTTRDLLGFDTSQTHKDISTLFQDIFFKGTDGQFSQRINIVTKPKIPNIFSIPKYFDLNGGYNVSYNYSNNFQEGDLGKTAGWTNNINLTSTLRLKSLTDPWFQSTPSQSSAQNQAPPPVQQVNDTTKNGSKDSTGQNPSKGSLNFLGPLKNAADYLIKIPFLNYESIGIQFQQSNSVSDPGVLGSTGFENFWRPPFLPSDTAYGPSRLYQLGLISDPTGSLVHHGGDPFFGWEVIPGKRAANAVLSDQFNQSNSIGLHTSRPLWDGASLDIIWNLKWSFTKTTTILTDSTGYPRSDTAGVVTTTAGNTDKTIFSFPLFGLFGSLKKVGELYGPYYAANPNDPNLGAELATSFQNGLEGLKYLPINYTFRWDGLQKIGFLSSIFKSLTLDHGYTSTFHQDWVNTTGIQQTNAERIQYGFSPLIGLTGTPKDFLGGNMSGSFKYNTTTAYDLSLSSANITETYTEDISISLNYGKHGFSLPLFGINLQNDVDFTLSFSLSKNTQTLFDPTILSTNQDGTPLGGTTTTTLEPRIRYGLSSRVTASVFFQYTNTSPAVSGATIFATTTTEAGVDISISIQP